MTAAPPTYLPGLRLGPGNTRFPWGPIDKIHEVGDIEVVEYRADRSNHMQPEAWGDHGRTFYHPYIAGRDTNRAYKSLDSALVGAIAIKREGWNGQAAEYFDLMTLTDGPA